jgi:hypothetical protein
MTSKTRTPWIYSSWYQHSIYSRVKERTVFKNCPTYLIKSTILGDPFYNYAKYPYQVTGVLGVKSVEVKDARECAMKCNKATDIHCRSFNFCQGQNDKYRCVLSELNVHSEDRNPDLVDSAICDHYSSWKNISGRIIIINNNSNICFFVESNRIRHSGLSTLQGPNNRCEAWVQCSAWLCRRLCRVMYVRRQIHVPKLRIRGCYIDLSLFPRECYWR